MIGQSASSSFAFGRLGGLSLALGLSLLWMIGSLGGFLLAGQIWPELEPMQRALIALIGLSAMTATLLSATSTWRAAGFNGVTQWRELHLVALPMAITVLPLMLGLKPMDTAGFWFLALGYALTGFAEEGVFRGLMPIVLRRLSPLGVAIISGVLFGLIHLGNSVIRGSFVISAFQALGAACFGFGMALLRLRLNTIWPLIVIHMCGDLFLQMGNLPVIPMAVVHDVLMLSYGLWLLREPTATGDAGNDFQARI